jgi:hypothetical protein
VLRTLRTSLCAARLRSENCRGFRGNMRYERTKRLTQDRNHISRDFLQLGRVVDGCVFALSRRSSSCVVAPHHKRLPNPRSSPQLLVQSDGPKIVHCRWCPSARCAQRDAVNENRVADAVASRGSDRRARRARRALLQRLVAAVGAPVETTATARNVHVSIKSVVSSRLARLASWLSRSCLSRQRLRVRRIPSKPRFDACSRSTGRRSLAPT